VTIQSAPPTWVTEEANVDLLIARLIDGLNNGVIYGFLGLALVCVYRGTGYLNLAQGEMAMFCAYLAYSFVGWGFPVVAAIVVVVLIGAAGGAVAERVLVRPLGRHAEYSVLLVTIGIFLALNTGAGVIWGGNPLSFPTVVPNGRSDYISIVGSRLHYQQIAILVILLAVLGLLFYLFRFTKLGLAMRTVAGNPDTARLLGIPVNRINSLGWVLAAAVGALLGPLVAPGTTLTTGMMLNYLIYATAAAALGGFDSPGGAVLSGILIGIVENLVASYVSFVGPSLKQCVALVVLVIVLVVRPTGLFGIKRVERV
jgi:branched-chain amino acid transport system permease protein